MSEIAAGGWEDTQHATSGASPDASAADPDATLRPSPPDDAEPAAGPTTPATKPPAGAVNDDRGTHQTATAATIPPPVGDNATTPAETAPTETAPTQIAQSPDAGELTLVLPDPTPAPDQLQDGAPEATVSASGAGPLISPVEKLDPPTISVPTIAKPAAAVATDSDTSDDDPTDSVDPIDADSGQADPGAVGSVDAAAGDAARERDLSTGSAESIGEREPGDTEADLITVIAEAGADYQADAIGDDSDAADQRSDAADRESDLAAAAAEVAAQPAADLAPGEPTSDGPDGSEDLVEAPSAEAGTEPDSEDETQVLEDAAAAVLAGLSAASSAEATSSTDADGPAEAGQDDEETTLTGGLPIDRTEFDPEFGVAAFVGAAGTSTTADERRPGPAALGGQRDRRKWIHVLRHGYVLRSRSGLTVVMVVVLVVLSLFGVTGLILFGGSPNSGTEKAVMFAPSTTPNDISLADLPQPVVPPAAQQPVGQPGPAAAQARAISHGEEPAAGSASNGGAARPNPPANPANKAPTTTTNVAGTNQAPAPTSGPVTVATSASPRCSSSLPLIENLLKLLGNC